MTRYLEAAAVAAVLLLALGQVPILKAVEPKVPPAPIPAQIVTAKKVFIANAGGDERFFDNPIFNGGPDRSYNQFYAAVKSAGKFELVGSPADADLIFEIQFLLPTAEPYANRGESIAPVAFDPQFRLVIRDPKTNALLWGFTEHVQWAILQGNRDKNFDQAATRLVADLQGLITRAAATSATAKP